MVVLAVIVALLLLVYAVDQARQVPYRIRVRKYLDAARASLWTAVLICAAVLIVLEVL